MSGVRTEEGLGEIVAISVVDGDDDLQTVSIGKVRNAANALKTFFSAMSAVAAPESVRGYGNSAGITEITTPSATVTVTGGVAPYDYLWARTDGGGHDWDIDAATSAVTSFTTEIEDAGTESATFECTVTDDTGAEAVSNEVQASARNLGGGL